VSSANFLAHKVKMAVIFAIIFLIFDYR
jgi:hypothetical protein